MKFYGVLKNCFKWLWNDYELIEWTRSCESTGQVHVWVDGDVQKGSDQPHVHNGSENYEVPKGNDEDLQPEGMDEGEMLGGNDETEMAKCSEHDEVSEDSGYEESPLSSFIDSDFEFENESDDDDDDVVEGGVSGDSVENDDDDSDDDDDDDHYVVGGGSVGNVSGDEDVVCHRDGSDDGVHEGRHLLFNNEEISSPTFEVGTVFETKDEFKKAVRSHAILTRRSLRFARSNKTRVNVTCRVEGCNWGINLVKRVNESTFKIKSYESAHNCEVHEGRYPVLNNEVFFNPSFEVGMVFETKDEFKKAVQTHAIQTRRSLRIVRNNKTRVYARCSDHNCDWAINLVKGVRESKFLIRSYIPVHKCAPTSNVSILNSKWLFQRFVSAFQNDPNRRVESWVKYMMRELNVKVSRQQAYRARAKALEMIGGFADEKLRRRKLTHQKTSYRRCNQVAGGEENVQVEEEESEGSMHGTAKRQKLKVCGNKSASSSGVTHPEEDFIVSGPSTRRKTRGRPRKSNIDNNSTQPPKSTLDLVVDEDEDDKFEALHTLTNAINPEEDFIVNPTRGKTRGKPHKSNIDNNYTEQPKSTLGLVDEDEDDRIEAQHTLASSATEAMSTVSCTRSHTQYQPLQLSLTPPSKPPMLSEILTKGKTRGRPRKLIIDNYSTQPPKLTLGLGDEDEDNNKFESLHTLASSATEASGLGMSSTVSCTQDQLLQLSLAPPSRPPILSGSLTRGKTRGRPRKLNVDDNSSQPSKLTLRLLDEDEDDKFEALLSLATAATNEPGLGMSTVSCTRSHI